MTGPVQGLVSLVSVAVRSPSWRWDWLGTVVSWSPGGALFTSYLCIYIYTYVYIYIQICLAFLFCFGLGFSGLGLGAGGKGLGFNLGFGFSRFLCRVANPKKGYPLVWFLGYQGFHAHVQSGSSTWVPHDSAPHGAATVDADVCQARLLYHHPPPCTPFLRLSPFHFRPILHGLPPHLAPWT